MKPEFYYWIIMILEALIAGLLIWDRFKTKTELKRLNNLLDKTGNYANMIDPDKIKKVYEAQLEHKQSENDKIREAGLSILERYEELNSRYEELLIMPIQIMQIKDVSQEVLNDTLDSYPLNAPIVRERLKNLN